MTNIRMMPFLLLLASISFANSPAPHEAPKGESPDQVLTELKAGNKRFVEGKLEHSHQNIARRKELVSGQKPGAIILSCSDSRLPPEIVFDQGLGDIFVVRVAGNILGNATVASIEYAVEHLGSRLIMILGHESCGAIKATLSTPPGKSAGSTDLDAIVAEIRGNLDGLTPAALKGDPNLHIAASANVDAVTTKLLKRSRIVRDQVKSGGVSIVKAVYSLETGKVEFTK